MNKLELHEPLCATFAMLPVRVAFLNQGRLNIWTERFYRNLIAKGKETLLTFRKGHNEMIYPQISFILCIISRTESVIEIQE